MLESVKIMQNYQFVHGDVKQDNLIVCVQAGEPQVMLIDLGRARYFDKPQTPKDRFGIRKGFSVF